METRLFIQCGIGNMIKREMSVQYQKHYSLNAYLCQIRAIDCGSSESEISIFQIASTSA